ncbi:MAG: 2'-5' RNA ligase family protein [Chloroflexi bacterium]|nr:2'-5' RNA ligase family protein [Chloroflexota bacterium]MBU1750743.1 2'-5' RNA ligase family protein [Chloroflexota bacterium]MBU1877347.1 2'-5' RNA ligase family protein [Chloroflexota bacterium]
MGFAVELYFDPATGARLTTLCAAVFQTAAGADLLAMGARPHISLVVLTDLDPAALRDDLHAFAESEAPLPVSLGAVGAFPSTEGVVYVAPVVTRELLDLHARFHRRLGELGLVSGGHYCPGHWIPHCTIGFELAPDRVPAAVDVCLRSDAFGPAHLTAIGLIEFRPVRELYTFPLIGT